MNSDDDYRPVSPNPPPTSYHSTVDQRIDHKIDEKNTIHSSDTNRNLNQTSNSNGSNEKTPYNDVSKDMNPDKESQGRHTRNSSNSSSEDGDESNLDTPLTGKINNSRYDNNGRPINNNDKSQYHKLQPSFDLTRNSHDITTFEEAIDKTTLRGGKAPYTTEESRKAKARRMVYLCGFAASLTSILLGYDVGIMADAIEHIDTTFNLKPFQSDIVMGCLNCVAAFGGLIAGKTADALGRNKAIGFSCLIFLLGASLMTLSSNFTTLLIGRIITGLGVGCGFVIAPVYIAEIAPPDIRGRMVSLTDVCINVGIMLGFVVGLGCNRLIENDDMKWRVMLGIGMFPPILILCILCVLPESPRWLIYNDHINRSKDVLRLITGSEETADIEFLSIQRSINEEIEITTGWKEVFCPKKREIMLPVLICVLLGIIQQASGSESAVYYSPRILEKAGMSNESFRDIFTVFVGFFKFFGEIIAMAYMDKVGRRPLFILSSSGVTLCLLLLWLCFYLHWSQYTVASGLCLFMFCFSLGLGAITFVVAAELVPLPVRGKTVALTTFTNRLSSGIVALTFDATVNSIDYTGYFFFFACVSFVTVFFFIYCLPETKGKTLEEISELFSLNPYSTSINSSELYDEENIRYTESHGLGKEEITINFDSSGKTSNRHSETQRINTAKSSSD